MADPDDTARPDVPAGENAAQGERVGAPHGVTRVRVRAAIEQTVAELDALKKFPSTWAFCSDEVFPDGMVYGEIDMVEIPGSEYALQLATADFPRACAKLGIKPRNPYYPLADDYIGTPEQNARYDISPEELARYAKAMRERYESALAPDAAASSVTPESAGGSDQPGTASSTTLHESKEPKMGSNPKEILDAHIARRARELHKKDKTATLHQLAEAIHKDFADKGYSGERGKSLSVATIEKAMPTGLTGGRRKNGRKAPRE